MTERFDLDARFQAAQAAAREAGALALSLRQGPATALDVGAKGLLDLCTEADRAAERLIRSRLADRFGDAMLGEEYGGAVGDRTWVVDPIDGTYNFVHGLPHWCVSIALVAAGQAQIGVLFNPATGQLYAARAGGGAWLDGRPIRVSGDTHADRPLVEVGCSRRVPLADRLATIARLAEAGFEYRHQGSGALGMAQVATGQIDAYVELHINAWDVAAGLALVREAGGWTNEFLAGDGLTKGNPILACTPALRDRLTTATGIR